MAVPYICVTCGVQQAPTEGPPAVCPICQDERQYVPPQGQRWTTLAEMEARGYRNRIEEVETGLWGVGTEPGFAIGQRALLLQTPEGNVLWDCICYLDGETVARLREMGGVSAICPSHPHFYGSMVEWARAFGARIYVPEDDLPWVQWREESVIVPWRGRLALAPGVTLVQCGGHFPGSAVLHWRDGAQGRGVLLSGDTIMVAPDRRHVTFMWSYPNWVPLSAAEVRGVLRTLDGLPFDRIYGAWWERVVLSDARTVLERSAARHVARLLALPREPGPASRG